MKIEEVIEKTSKLVYKICYDIFKDPQLSEDVVQEVYINLFKAFHRYSNLSENELKNIVCKIALNRCRDILKNNGYKLNKESDLIEDNVNYEVYNDIDEKMFERERKEYILKMINLLKEPYSYLLKEYYIEEYSLDEIALKYSKSKGTIKMQIFRGKEKLENILRKNGGDKYLWKI